MKLEQYGLEIINIEHNEVSQEMWSRIIERLKSVDLWPEGKEGLALALSLVGISTQDIENE